ncbi:hypothetical protein [Planobispora longispora]|uniref:Uncharacterized protein n=1 Tax=Planobispora longispora TaxID=28887 RepID=A0A8J3RHH1_9ACTN|nr:hypothetical protein [Planobispora longispora]GIH76466.1 hypothetical protein Plo01_28950 [Planobispora longispora]
MLSWDGYTLVAADPAAGGPARLRPAALYHYRYAQEVGDSDETEKKTKTVHGLAALDRDGLVLAVFPGRWRARDVTGFAETRGVPVVNALDDAPARVRATLAGRAPDWGRFTGLPAARLARWKRIAAVGAGVAGLLVMAYVATTAGWIAWRGLGMLGNLLLDLLDAKWLAIFFAPLVVVLAPLRRRMHTGQVRRGVTVGFPDGPRLRIPRGKRRKLRVTPGRGAARTDLDLGPGPDSATSLTLYRHEGLRGLFVLDGHGCPLYHLPGPWNPEDAHRFAVRNGLGFEVRALNRAEYLDLATQAWDALP